MHKVIPINGRLVTMTVPDTAAAYSVVERDTEATIYFALLQDGENDLDAIARVDPVKTGGTPWRLVSSCPEQHRHPTAPYKFAEYKLAYKDDVWVPVDSALAQLMSTIGAASGEMPSAPESIMMQAIGGKSKDRS